ncbi:hypothetical protein diail_5287 [Diaporthe ilicicola]|nr:hypothetical protein diail_5287 [Diaporthe ilicicola]
MPSQALQQKLSTTGARKLLDGSNKLAEDRAHKHLTPLAADDTNAEVPPLTNDTTLSGRGESPRGVGISSLAVEPANGIEWESSQSWWCTTESTNNSESDPHCVHWLEILQ